MDRVVRGHPSLLLVLFVVSSATARGDDLADREEAKRLKDLGATAFDRGDHQVALDLFARAFAAFPSPRLRFNLGMALASVGRYPEALDEYERFLAEAQDAPVEARTHAQQRLEELAGRVARLTVTIEPAGATLLVDGKPTPRDRPLRVLPGEHEVGARLAGYQPASTTIQATAGSTRSVALQLQRQPASIVAAPPTPPGTRRRAALWSTFAVALSVGGAAIGVGLGVGLSRPSTALGAFDVTF